MTGQYSENIIDALSTDVAFGSEVPKVQERDGDDEGSEDVGFGRE